MTLAHPRRTRPYGAGPRPRTGARTVLDEHLPVDHKLSRVYRAGAGLMGLVLLAFGILGLTGAVGLQNVLFSFVVGLMLLVFGMYGRVGSALPHDNPYWRSRHPGESEREQRARARRRRSITC